MIVNLETLNFNVECKEEDIGNKKPVVFLHGFTGCVEDWYFLKGKIVNSFTPIFIDLIGHGKTSSPNNIEEYSEHAQVEQLKNILNYLNITKVVMVGYSMGGRLAVSFTAKYPDLVEGLILESTSFGIETKIEREVRIKQDTELADRINNLSLKDFFDYWYNIPLFNSLSKLPKNKLIDLKTKRVEINNKSGLQNSLLGFGTGKMNYHLYKFIELKKRILLISGKLDNKFSEINKLTNEKLKNSELVVIKNCGHNVHY